VAADGTFSVKLTTGVEVQARALVVATGLTDSIPNVDGLWERWGRDVLHCPYCHGWEVRDEALLVVGRDRGALEQALLVRQWSATVTLLTDGTHPAAEDLRRLRAMGVAVDDRPLRGVHIVDDRLAGVRTSGGAIVPGNAVFVRPALTPNDALLRKLGCDTVDGAGTVSVDRSGATSVRGLFAAGNVVDLRAQVITAAGAGSAAAIAANQYLTDRDVADRLC
jgi:thioredoxin reductase